MATAALVLGLLASGLAVTESGVSLIHMLKSASKHTAHATVKAAKKTEHAVKIVVIGQ